MMCGDERKKYFEIECVGECMCQTEEKGGSDLRIGVEDGDWKGIRDGPLAMDSETNDSFVSQ